jgi:hypothetical protein
MSNTITNEPEPSTQSELITQARKVEDLCVALRAEAYKLEMSIRKCEKCIANGGKP